MPTKVPRVAVLLDSTAYEAVRYLALASGKSMSRIVGEVVEAVAPVLSRTADVLQVAKRAQEDQRQGLLEVARAAHERLAPLEGAGLALAEEHLFGPLERAAGAGDAPKRAAAPAARKPDPRASNTGVRSPAKPATKRTRRTRKSRKS